MNFKEYDNFISNHKYDMLHFVIYYNLKVNSCFIDYDDYLWNLKNILEILESNKED